MGRKDREMEASDHETSFSSGADPTEDPLVG